MINVLENIFNYYSYQKIYITDKQKENSISFYKHENNLIANYFLVYEIDCREIESDEQKVKSALDELERLYVTKSKLDNSTLRHKIQEQFESTQEASQIDKNTSAIYLLQFGDIKKLSGYKNLVYSIEESPNYFKRYILPYTESQGIDLKNSLTKFNDKKIDEVLSQIVDNEDFYFQLSEQKDLESSYGLVIRMFSKIPFLKYSFKAEIAPPPIEKSVESKLYDKQLMFHNYLANNQISSESILKLADDFVCNDTDINNEINERLKGVLNEL